MKISWNGLFTAPRQLPRNFVHAGGLHVRNILRTLSHSPGGNNVVAGIDVAAGVGSEQAYVVLNDVSTKFNIPIHVPLERVV
jgi:hypothetical protein